MNKAHEILKKFAPRDGFGAMGFPLDIIAKDVAKLYKSRHIRFNVPYYNFNCRGTANRIAKEVVGVMPFSKKPLDEATTTTFFYGDKKFEKGYLPFLSIYDVYYVTSAKKEGNEIVFDLVKGQNRYMYL